MNELQEMGCETFTNSDDCGDAFVRGCERVRLASPSPFEGAEMFDTLKEIDDILMVYDEADLCLRNQHNPQSFAWIVNYGRHVGQGMMLLARRPQSLPREYTAQSVLFFSDTMEPRDQQYLKERIGHLPPIAGEYCWRAHNFDGQITEFDRNWAPGILARAS